MFTGKELDQETGLYYFGARYLDPQVNRWMSPDPSGADLINPMEKNEEGELVAKNNYSVIESLNWYSFCRNNPVKYKDPTGKDTYIFSLPVALGARHIFIAVRNENTGAITTRGLYPDDVAGVLLDYNHKSDVHIDESIKADELGAATTYFNGDEMPEGYKFEGRIQVPEGMTSEEFDKKVLELADSYSETYGTQEEWYTFKNKRPYYLLGPNSNTAADDIIENAGGTMPDVEGAWAQNWGENSGESPSSTND